MKLSTLVRSSRSKLGLNLRDLAQNMNVSASFLSRIENGAHVRISDRRLLQLSEALGVSVDEVFRCARRLPPDVHRFVLENMDSVRRTMARQRAVA